MGRDHSLCRGHPVHCGMRSSVPGSHPRDAHCPPSRCDNQSMSPGRCPWARGSLPAENPWARCLFGTWLIIMKVTFPKLSLEASLQRNNPTSKSDAFWDFFSPLTSAAKSKAHVQWLLDPFLSCSPTSGYLSKRSETRVWRDGCAACLLRPYSRESSCRTTQVSSSGWMGTENVVCPHRGISFSLSKEESPAICNYTVDLEDIMPSEISQSEEDEYCTIPLPCGL